MIGTASKQSFKMDGISDYYVQISPHVLNGDGRVPGLDSFGREGKDTELRGVCITVCINYIHHNFRKTVSKSNETTSEKRPYPEVVFYMDTLLFRPFTFSQLQQPPAHFGGVITLQSLYFFHKIGRLDRFL